MLYGSLMRSEISATKFVKSSSVKDPLREKGRDMEVSGWPLLKNDKTSIHWLAESTSNGFICVMCIVEDGDEFERRFENGVGYDDKIDEIFGQVNAYIKAKTGCNPGHCW